MRFALGVLLVGCGARTQFVNEQHEVDAGPAQSELCDGRDNDFDGLVDRDADGGWLTRSCPLTLGVCGSARSLCRDGGWAACDYGPDYERTERRCDGLDNDCDGRVDTSWKRTLLEADAGRLGVLLGGGVEALFGADVEMTQLVPGSNGHWLSLPNDLLMINEDLEVTGRTRFPVNYNGHAYLFPNGSEWIRVANNFEPGGVGFNRIVFSQVGADGSFPLEVDGRMKIIAEVAESPLSHGWGGGLRAGAIDGGWVAFTAHRNWLTPGLIGNWATLALDGGLSQGAIDAGPQSWGQWWPMVSGAGSEFVIVPYQPQTTDVYSVHAGSDSASLRLSVVGDCFVVTTAPLTYSCIDSMTSWRDEAGTLLTAPFHGRPFGDWAQSSRLLAGTWDPLVDGGLGGWGDAGRITINELRDGGLLPYAIVDGAPLRSEYVFEHDLGGRLQLLTWAENVGSTCPVCPIERFSAEYVCAPP